ncbi:MAG: hypothetical protein AAF433_16400 [Bacteroidota bacterium]
MDITKIQAHKQKIIAHLLEEKQAAYQRMMQDQQSELDMAEEVGEGEEDLYERGKIDQAMNRVEAKAQTLESLQEQVDLLANLDQIEPTEEIQLGDIIETNMGNFFVGVPAMEFTIEGKQYRGISTDSPLYHALQGKHQGDKVEVNGHSYDLIHSY